jgi:3-phenylpropionate/cinnamic acid dioxygenase small subunit
MRAPWLGWLLALSVGLGGCATAGPPSRAADHLDVLNHVSCYPFGLDQIGRGDVAAGTETWKQCFAEDYQFSLFLGFGERTVCPGPSCPLPAAMGSIDKRVAFARRVYDSQGYVRTSHHLSNQRVTFTEPDLAQVRTNLSAWHMKPDGSIVTAVGQWDVQVARAGHGWRITQENLTITGAGTLQPLRR